VRGLGDIGTGVIRDVVEGAYNTLNSLDLAYYRRDGIGLGESFMCNPNWDGGGSPGLYNIEFLDKLVDILILVEQD